MGLYRNALLKRSTVTESMQVRVLSDPPIKKVNVHSNNLNKYFFWAAIELAPEWLLCSDAQDWFAFYSNWDGI